MSQKAIILLALTLIAPIFGKNLELKSEHDEEDFDQAWIPEFEPPPPELADAVSEELVSEIDHFLPEARSLFKRDITEQLDKEFGINEVRNHGSKTESKHLSNERGSM